MHGKRNRKKTRRPTRCRTSLSSLNKLAERLVFFGTIKLMICRFSA
jgi:ribosomal protein L18